MDPDVLYAQLYKVESQDNASMRVGVVQAINPAGGLIDVEVAGELLREIPYAAGLSPFVGQTVWLIEQGSWFAAIAASSESTGNWDGEDQTADPVVVNWFDTNAEGWVQFSGGGSLTWAEMDSPSMPGVMDARTVQGYNLLTANQASVETDTTGFSPSGTLTRVATGGFHGSAFARLVTKSTSGYLQFSNTDIPVTAGKTYTTSVTVKVSATAGPATWGLYVVWKDAASSLISQGYVSPTRTDKPSGWTTLTYSAVAPAGATKASPRLNISPSVAGETFDMDAMGFWEGDGGSWAMPGTPIMIGNEVWAEWQASGAMVYEPEALYRVRVRAKLDTTAFLSFGLQCYATDGVTVVDSANGSDPLKPHWCVAKVFAGDSAWENDTTKPGEWLAWTGYLSSRADAAAENIPDYPNWTATTYNTGARVRYVPSGLNYESLIDGNTGSPVAAPDNWKEVPSAAPAEAAVRAASDVRQWRPMFRVTGGRAWIDAVEVYRLDRDMELPGGVRVGSIEAQSVTANTVTAGSLVVPPAIPGYLMTAQDDAGTATWQPMPVEVSEGPPARANMLTVAQEQCASSGWVLGGTFGTLAFNSDQSMTITASATPAVYIEAVPAGMPGAIPVTASTTYTFSAQLTGTGTSAWRVYASERNAAGTWLADRMGNIITGTSGASTVTFTTSATTASVIVTGVYRGSGAAGDTATISQIGLWEGGGISPDAPTNPETIVLGTLYGKHGGALITQPSLTAVTGIVTARVPGSKALQWTQVVPAMVTINMMGYLYQTANSVQWIYVNIGVEDDAGTALLTDDYTAATTGTGYGGTVFRSATGGAAGSPFTCFWRRYLGPGTYLAYPRAWLGAVDAASVKSVGYVYLTFDIDPEMTYLPGMR